MATYSKLQGYAQQGGATVQTQGLLSSTKVDKFFHSCTITVYDAGTTIPSTIYSDSVGTPKSNPFLAASDGLWFFYSVAGHYDIRFSGTGISSPFTISDVINSNLV